jgi:hypothetical protein
MVPRRVSVGEVATQTGTFRPVVMREVDFERLLLNLGPSILSGWFLREWKPLLTSIGGRATRPDAILVSRTLAEWYVVEIEPASHSLLGLARPQFERIRWAIYDFALRESILRVCEFLNEHTVDQLLRRAPGFLCISDEDHDRLRQVCQEVDFEFAAFEPLRSERNHLALRVLRLPAGLQRDTPARAWPLSRSRTPMMGSEPAYLPLGFPTSTPIQVTINERDYLCEIRAIGDTRVLLLPAEVTLRLPGNLILDAVDPANRIYRLETRPP